MVVKFKRRNVKRQCYAIMHSNRVDSVANRIDYSTYVYFRRTFESNTLHRLWKM